MNDPLVEQNDAATPITPEERAGLKPAYITTRAELNEAEEANVLMGEVWLLNSSRRINGLLNEAALRRLHAAMFGDVWRWAGDYRITARNIGVEAHQIAVEMRMLLDDARYWVDHNTFPPDEIGVRFHHRLVAIHCYPNGNGRHARLAADGLAVQLGRPRFSWGQETLIAPGNTRSRYIAALKAADNHAIEPLLAFARS
jgi:Fic-DOC domain mobile mystery protein B